MRISGFRIVNYRGIAVAEADNLSDEPVLMISGRNGTGKTLVREALASAWQGYLRRLDAVGPWGDSAQISMTVSLTSAETEAVSRWLSLPGSTYMSSELTYAVELDRTTEQWKETRRDHPLEILRSESFQREHPFAVLDFLSAHRQTQSSVAPTVDLGMFSGRRKQEDRRQLIQQHVDYGHDMMLPDVGSYLLTLDYRNYLTQRQDLDVADDFEVIASAFESATGKRIRSPQFDPERGESSIDVQLPSGPSHALNFLSSGEREMLALMYFVRRLSATGGVLFIDEPEKHLHPSLQAGLIGVTAGLADRAQVLLVTHSVNLISVASPVQMLEMEAPSSSDSNQLRRLSDRASRVRLLESMGIVPADFAQNDFVLIVEGERDAQWIRSLFPIEAARALVYVAGSGKQVLQTCAVLEDAAESLAWVAVMDRDLATDAEVEQHIARHTNLFVWGRREFENVLLEPNLVAATVARVGVDLSESQINDLLANLARPLLDEVVEQTAQSELRMRVPVENVKSGAKWADRTRARLVAIGEAHSRRASAFDQVIAEVRDQVEQSWQTTWPAKVDGKALIASLRSELKVFGSPQEFIAALLVSARENPASQPRDIQELGARLRQAIDR